MMPQTPPAAGTQRQGHAVVTGTSSGGQRNPLIVVHPAETTIEEHVVVEGDMRLAIQHTKSAKIQHDPHVADEWSVPQTVRSGSFSGGTTDRSGSTGAKLSPHSGPAVFASYPYNRAFIPHSQKQVAFLALQPADVHEVHVQYPAGNIRLDSASREENSLAQNCIYERHPRLLNSIYRADLSLKYELLVPPKKTTRNIVDILSRLFARASGVITTSSRNEASRLTHLPEVVVVQNEHASASASGTRPPSSAERTSALSRSRSSSAHNVTIAVALEQQQQPRSRLGTNSSHDQPLGIIHELRQKRAQQERVEDTADVCEEVPRPDVSSRKTSFGHEQFSIAKSSRRQTGTTESMAGSVGAMTLPVGSLSSQGVGFVLNSLPPPHPRSPPPQSSTTPQAERPDSPHIATPTRTGGSMSSSELDASTPDRYKENASALYLLQPISVNTFRRLRPQEAMNIRYIDRTSSLSLCVSGTDHSSDLEKHTFDDDFEGSPGERGYGGGYGGGGGGAIESGSLMSHNSEFGDFCGANLIPSHKRALVYQGGEWLINNPDRTVYTLLYTKHTKVGMKDFAVDVRAQLDTDRLLRDCVVVLDSQDSHIYRIMQRLVSAIVDKDFDATGRTGEHMRKARCKDEALKGLFVDKSVTVLSRCIQGGCLSEMLDDTLDIQMACDQVWMCAFTSLHDVCGRHVAFSRMNSPVNMGHISEELKFVVLVMTPSVEKSTKTALETARTFATLFLDVETRNQLSGAIDEQEFRDVLTDHANRLHAIQEHPELVRRLTQKRASRVYFKSRCLSWYPGQGIYLDVKRRWPHYKSDFIDGIRGPNTVHKLLSTIVFLYFAVLLPTLAFGVLNDSNTNGKIGVQKHIFAQVFGGLAFGIFGGQPLLVIMTTAPLGLYMRILYSISNQFKVDFFAFYSCIGLWNSFFLSIYALMNTSCLTNLCTRTIQDIFEMFALFAFVVDGLTELMHNFGEHYFSEACSRQSGTAGRTGVWRITGSGTGRAGSGSGTSTDLTTAIESSTSLPSTTGSTTTSVSTSTFSPLFDIFGYLTGSQITAAMNKRSADGSGDVGDYFGMSEDSIVTQIVNSTTATATGATTTAASVIVKLFEEMLTSDPFNTTTQSYVIFDNETMTPPTLMPQSPGGIVVSQPVPAPGECRRDRALLYLLLMLATWWSSLRLHGFAKTPYLNKSVREFLADYSLPISIIAVSLVGRLVFGDVQLEQFTIYDFRPTRAPIENLPLWCVFVCCGVGFIISLLFFFDTTITNSVVCRPTNKLKKGTTYDYDLLIVALINGVLSLFSLPWLYPTTPQSPLHLLGLADVEERVDAGHVYQAVVRVRETRLTTIVASVMIGLSLFMLPYPLAYISRPVLNGLFLYMAAMSIHDNQLMERIMLLFTEQNAYPPHHYIRTVPQRQLHLITVIQIFQLVVICGLGLYGQNIYVEMLFPIVLCLMFPVRHSLMPKIIDIKFLESLEGQKISPMARRIQPSLNAGVDM